MNKVGLYINLIISILIITFSCTKNSNFVYTGLYDGTILITNKSERDTLIKTVIVINRNYDANHCYEIQWYFDDFLTISNQRLNIPNILYASIQKRVFSEQPTIKLYVNQVYGISKVTGNINNQFIFITIEYPNGRMIKIRGTRFQD